MLAAACSNREAPRARDAAAAPAIDAAIDAAADAAVAAEVPHDAAEAPAITKLVASGDSTCAILADHTIRCWGANAHGQLGNGATSDAAAPVVPAIHSVVDLQLADATACALLDDASVACWGQIAWRGRGEDVLRPTGVLGVIGVKQIFVVPGRACARVANDSLVCWGSVDARGHFTTGAHRAPTAVVGLDHIAGLTLDGAFSDDGRAWRFAAGGSPRRLDTTGALEVAARDGTTCARLDGGRVVCADTGRCGAAHAGTADEPGSATPAGKSSAAKPATAKPAVAATATATAGKPSAGKPSAKPAHATTKPAGKPTAAKPPTAAPRPNLDAVVATALSSARQLAFRIGYCIVNTTGRLQCGDGCRKLDPIALERVDTIIDRCALLKSGTVSCFDGTKFVAVPGLIRAKLLAVGRAHACAVAFDRIACWGDDSHHQLGEYLITR